MKLLLEVQMPIVLEVEAERLPSGALAIHGAVVKDGRIRESDFRDALERGLLARLDAMVPEEAAQEEREQVTIGARIYGAIDLDS